MTQRITQALRRFRRDENGIAAVEFVVFFPMLFGLFLWAVELGSIMSKQVMLEFAVDVAMRDLRLGNFDDPTADRLKDRICENSLLIKDCRGSILLELQPVNNWVVPATPVQCVNRDEEIRPSVTYNGGIENQVMLVRACVIVDPLFPGIGFAALLPSDSRGGFAIAAVSAFVNEPS